MGSEELAQALRRLVGRRGGPFGRLGAGSACPPAPVPPHGAASLNTSPACTFGAVVDARLGHLEKGLEEVKGRLTALLLLVAGAVIAEVVRRLL